ncbi:MAG: DUF4468 domain-containing protein [Tannerellaceae bacterium]|jgi:flavin reductase (DIM6/NTAB) family NADH-FMN oxidoreductase RutF|nr:DUF4468 domain-containing protein [Tannerellaceae bacterium]
MKQLLLPVVLLSVPAFLFAQTDTDYLAGAVPEENGKVIFSKEINTPALSKDHIYESILSWVQSYFKGENNRLVYSDKEKGDIIVAGEDYLVFSSSALSLDRSLMSYRMIVKCGDKGCKLSVTNIRYKYGVSYQQKAEQYTAEEWITDKNALTKRNKLNRGNGKFRRKTIDFIHDLFQKAEAALAADPAIQPTVPETPPEVHDPIAPPPPPVAAAPVSTAMEGYRHMAPGNIPGNIIKMLSEDWMLITAGNETAFNMMTASWGGLGHLYGKPVAFCFINPARFTYRLMEENDTYTLTFYTEAYRSALEYCGKASGKDTDKVKGSGLTPITTPSGSKAFSEAWMIIECRKLIAQSLNAESLNAEKLRKEWTGREMHKMFAGEIIHVWIK